MLTGELRRIAGILCCSDDVKVPVEVQCGPDEFLDATVTWDANVELFELTFEGRTVGSHSNLLDTLSCFASRQWRLKW